MAAIAGVCPGRGRRPWTGRCHDSHTPAALMKSFTVPVLPCSFEMHIRCDVAARWSLEHIE